jgi:hypothetical protein
MGVSKEGRIIMAQTVHDDHFNLAQGEIAQGEIEVIAWTFLKSEFTGHIYAGWPIDRRIEAFLYRYGPRSLLSDGSAYDALVQHVMANVGRALRTGLLSSA